MLRSTVYFLLVLSGLAIAGPPVMRSKKEIEDFANYLDRVRNGINMQIASRSLSDPEEMTEEVSGRFQGDLVLDDTDYEVMLQEFSMGRNAYTTSSIKTWPNKTVIFEFRTGQFSEKQQEAIWNAIRDIEAHTCVKFRYRKPTDSVYVFITGNSDGCYAHIGYRKSRGAHTMNLARASVGTGCFRHVTIVHEFMHILGFTHMHATYNRDDYVDIIEDNISSGNEHNFDIYDASRINDYGIEYDYESCMHYSSTSFTKNGLPTIVPTQDETGEMGQRRYVTDSDWLRINRHYSCPGAWD